MLVHCNAGVSVMHGCNVRITDLTISFFRLEVSRSATVVIAFLMNEKNFSFQEAFDHVKKRRPCIRPNEGFVKQLQLLEHIQNVS